MKANRDNRRGERGLALLLVLVTVMALGLVVGALWEASQPGWEENTLERARFQAGLLAESGATVGLHPAVEPGDAALRQEFGSERGFEVRLGSEGARLPVNGIADEIWREAAVELFVSWGLDAVDASRAADSLADWIDEDDEPLSNGAENAHYAGLDFPEYPPNEAFTSLEQMLFVEGMDVVARAQPRWRDFFTIHSDGLLDFNEASWELIRALTGATEDSALQFVAVRHGDDGEEATVDDYRFEDLGEVRGLLGLSDREWDRVSGYVTLAGGVRRIESTGRVGDFTVTRVVLARENQAGGGETGFSPVARFWK